jgi:hypothetical protein
LAEKLELKKSTVSWRVSQALKDGWLRNLEQRKGYPYRLQRGDPLPDEVRALPTPEKVREAFESIHPKSSCPDDRDLDDDDGVRGARFAAKVAKAGLGQAGVAPLATLCALLCLVVIGVGAVSMEKIAPDRMGHSIAPAETRFVIGARTPNQSRYFNRRKKSRLSSPCWTLP